MITTLEEENKKFFKEEPSNQFYTKEAIKMYAIGNAVKVIDFDDEEYIGWLIEDNNDYKILPLNTIWKTYGFKLKSINGIYHLTNGVLIPKKIKKR